jgi:hypothetical protein
MSLPRRYRNGVTLAYSGERKFIQQSQRVAKQPARKSLGAGMLWGYVSATGLPIRHAHMAPLGC